MEALDILFTASLWAAAIRIASPLIFATLGELICERAGVLNLGIEGIMTAGAFAGWLTVFLGGDLWLGVLVAALAGAALRPAAWVPGGAARPVAACHRHRHHAACHQPLLLLLPPGISGSHLAAQDRALSALADSGAVRYSGHRRSAVPADAAHLSGLPCRRPRRLVPLPHARPASPSARWAKTRSAAEAQGIDVTLVRIGAVVAGSALMGIGGSFLTLSAFNSFFFEMMNGRGWICIALVVFGSWRPGKALARRASVRRFRCLSAAPAATGRRLRSLPGVPDAALRAVHPRTHRHVAPRRLSARPDGALSQGRALNHGFRSSSSRTAPCPMAARLRHRHRLRTGSSRLQHDINGDAPARPSTPRGYLVSPPFVDCALPHGRDPVATASRASTRRARCSRASSLWGELKPLLTHEAVIERALAYCDWAVSMGLLAHPHPCRCLR